MSVLSCDRKGCESIMCDYYSPNYGYLCRGCVEEYEHSHCTSVGEFMETRKFESSKGIHKENIFDHFEYL